MMANEDEVARQAVLMTNHNSAVKKLNYLLKKQQQSVLISVEEKQVQQMIDKTKPLLRAIIEFMYKKNLSEKKDSVGDRIMQKLIELQD